jgi:hypothetical protein
MASNNTTKDAPSRAARNATDRAPVRKTATCRRGVFG